MDTEATAYPLRPTDLLGVDAPSSDGGLHSACERQLPMTS